MITTPHQSAYPLKYEEKVDEYRNLDIVNEGLTKREFFAAMALASGSTPKDAVQKADSLIEQLNNKQVL
jgi:hypothetical protein